MACRGAGVRVPSAPPKHEGLGARAPGPSSLLHWRPHLPARDARSSRRAMRTMVGERASRARGRGSRTRPATRRPDRDAMPWLVLILSGGLEAVWATALAASDGFRRPRPTVLFAVSLLLSTAGLAWAMTGLPTGTAYAVWVGIGAVGTVLLAVSRGQERLGAARAALLLVLVGCVAGLKAVA